MDEQSSRLHASNNDSAELLLDLSKVGRKTALRTWLIYHGISEKTIARKLSVSASTVTRLLSGERRSQSMLKALVDMGIPRDLLDE
ncbi:helix-turn-helix domain protein [Desulfovibrio sp. X2]|uniref:helix-turn-helix domain-containing protein n=1 Tax=Desulfovibrio sp. X2 TaxID=941449 RepID=UPI000358BB99|nr:helix-turn-helix transcriptional regulator [Desulfovibrio sp. X2]EPR42773.1 helix-turn-helix domain protein [Desulfovibrio sp. X2]